MVIFRLIRKKPVKDYENLLKVKTFTEKPDLELAKVFLESGDFFWNSGIFIWNMKSIMHAFEKHMPDTFLAFGEGRNLFGTKQESSFIGKTYAECRSISIDYGIMEKADNVYVMSALISAGQILVPGLLFMNIQQLTRMVMQW